MKVNEVEKLVKYVMVNKPETRNDDFLLIYEVARLIYPNIKYYSFENVMKGHKTFCVPIFESITRSRRKLQAEYEELRSTKQVERARKEKESEYVEYSKKI
jgi:hypothetical protein